MSLALKFGDIADPTALSGVIYFDAVTSYTRDFSGRVTSHPIEAGASITDHFISNNPTINFSCVISSVDITSIGNRLVVDGETPMNASPQPSVVSIGSLGGLLREMTPGVISQFFPRLLPSINMDRNSKEDFGPSIAKFLEDILSGLQFNAERKRWENRMVTATLYEIERGVPINPLQDLVITKFVKKEDENTGDAFFADITLEKVNFVTLEVAEAPKVEKGTPTSRKTGDTKNKGTVNSTPRPAPSKEKERITVLGQIEKAGR